MNTANHFKDKQKTQNQTQLSQEDFDFLRACVVMFKSAKKSVNYLYSLKDKETPTRAVSKTAESAFFFTF